MAEMSSRVSPSSLAQISEAVRMRSLQASVALSLRLLQISMASCDGGGTRMRTRAHIQYVYLAIAFHVHGRMDGTAAPHRACYIVVIESAIGWKRGHTVRASVMPLLRRARLASLACEESTSHTPSEASNKHDASSSSAVRVSSGAAITPQLFIRMSPRALRRRQSHE